MSCQDKTVLPQDVPTGGDFKIQSTQGILDTKNLRAKTVFLFFGFTQCPQVCPTTLSNLKKMIKLLPVAEQSQVEVIFISVDTKRDNLDTLKAKLEPFSSRFIGAIDTEENLRKIMKLYGASFNVVGDIIDHTALIFMINRKGEWVESLNYDATAEELLAAYQAADSMSPVYADHRRPRALEVVGENKTCDLAKTPCELSGFEVSIGPYPIVPEKSYEVTVKTSDKTLIPQEIDFEGVDANMGYIRPQLKMKAPGVFTGEFSLPFCESPELQWRARLILKTPNDQKAKDFFFRTTTHSTAKAP